MSNSREVNRSLSSKEVLESSPAKEQQAETPTEAVAHWQDNGPVVTRRELVSYYLYYSGDNSVGPLVFTLTLLQSLLFSAGHNPSDPGQPCDGTTSGMCVVPWLGGTISVSGVLLVANGLSFGILTLLFITFGSVADYGFNGRWMLIGVTLIFWGSQFALVSVKSASDWPIVMGLFIVAFISLGCTLVLYLSMFPRLARNTPKAKATRRKYEAGEIGLEECEVAVSLEHNRVSNISLAYSCMGYLVMLCLNLTLLLPLKNNPRVNIYVIVLLTAFAALTGIWWFIFQQPRPGPRFPKEEKYLTIGWKQIWLSCKEYRKLPHAFTYLIAYFFLAGGLNTTTTLVLICQNDQFSFGFLENTYLGLAQAITSVVSVFAFWVVQKRLKIPTKTMFAVTNVWTILIPLWGMSGIWTPNFGFHRPWEFWAYNALFGFFQAPYYSFAQTMMAEVMPQGFDTMFFGLLGVSNSASSMLMPIVLTALIDRTGNNWIGFSFLFAVCLSASLLIWFCVDVRKGRRDAVAWAEETRRKFGNER